MKLLLYLSMMFILIPIGKPVMAEERTVTLTVENMTCSLCPVTVKKALKAVEGVREASVSFESGDAVVTFNDETADIQELIDATTNAGFPSFIAQEDQSDDDQNP